MITASTITVAQLSDSCRRSLPEVIDVRTPIEFREAHLKMARNVPLDSLDPRTVMTGRAEQDQPLYVICKAGGRGASACRKFQQAGFANVVNVEGGTQAWIDAGLPVVRGQNAISLERQVRVAAGFLVLLGAGLGYFLNINFIGLSAFVGAGLMFAGITDTCGMAMVLAKMPWNQVSDAACSSP
jgi:rhodanese-related sulfurtransferase